MRKISSTKNMEEPERVVFDHDPHLYSLISPLVPSLPDFRLACWETVNQMKRTEEGEIEIQNNWQLILTELQALHRKGGEEDRALMESLCSGEETFILPFLEKEEMGREFFLTYPALIWLIERIGPEESVHPFLARYGRIDTLPINEKTIRWVRDRGTIRKMREKDPDAIFVNEDTFFSWIERGELGLFLWGLEACIDPTIRENYAICLAAEKGHANMVAELLQDGRVNPTINDNKPLLSAIKKNHIGVVSVILTDGVADPTFPRNKPLRLAAQKGRREIVELLLKDGRVDLTDHHPLVYAVKQGHRAVVEQLLPIIDISKTREDLLEEAVLSRDERIFHMVLQDERVTVSGCSLLAAAALGHLPIVESLLNDSRIDPTYRDYIPGYSTMINALEAAAGNGHLPIVERLLAVLDPSANDNTTIVCAARSGNVEVVKRLLQDERVNPAINKNAPMREAAERNHLDVVELLLTAVRSRPHLEVVEQEIFFHYD